MNGNDSKASLVAEEGDVLPSTNFGKPRTKPSQYVRTDLLSHDFGRLLDDHESADLVFIIGESETKYLAHKLVIWARCKTYRKYSKELFYQNPDEKYATVKQTNFSPKVFSMVLRYIYMASIMIVDEHIFEILSLANQLGMADLAEACKMHLMKMINCANACELFTKTVSLIQCSNTFDEAVKDDLVSDLLTFIGENAEECINTQGWLEMSKEAMEKAIISETLFLEEADVWRSVIRWATHQCGTVQSFNNWSEADRENLSVLMADIIPHIRFLLINSKIFACEVEPTRLVPSGICLERYKLAALPAKSQSLNTTDSRFTPRIKYRLFWDSDILSGEHRTFQRHMALWYGSFKQEWRLLYRGTRDGFCSKAFHQHCDGYAPTFVVVRSTGGCISGGYSDVPWSSSVDKCNGKFEGSMHSFLFTLVNRDEIGPMKFPVQQYNFAVCSHPDFGPVFGAGPDLLISHNCNTNTDSKSYFPHSYTARDLSPTILMGDQNFAVFDYEVFALKDALQSGASN